jgi:hypothetical protein
MHPRPTASSKMGARMARQIDLIGRSSADLALSWVAGA